MFAFYKFREPTELIFVIEPFLANNRITLPIVESFHVVHPSVRVLIIWNELTSGSDVILKFAVDVWWSKDVHHATEVTCAANQHTFGIHQIWTRHCEIAGCVFGWDREET